jgi:Uncharacterized protein conserved in bacteria
MCRDTMCERLLSCLLILVSLSSLAADAPAQDGPGLSGPSVHATDALRDGPDRVTNPSSDSAGVLTVRVVGLESDKGTVRIELTTAKSYGGTGNVRLAERPIQNRTARWTLDDVPHGTYAVALYHDQNSNDELDTNVLGRPQEPYGFSNDARGTMGPPDFEEAAFTLSSDSLSLTITAK